MKKFIQICSVLSLLVAFSFISAQAQTAKSYDAKIPFDFNFGQKFYKSGDYVIKISKSFTGTSVLSLQDKAGNNFHNVIILDRGEASQNKPKLIFDRYGNELFLSKVITPEKGFTLYLSNKEKQFAKEKRETDTKTQIALNPSKR